MAQHWLLKTEPSTYSYEDLEREGRARWDGVKNAVALKHLRAMAPGDAVAIYHTGDVKAVVGLAEVASAPYPDPTDAKLTVCDLVPKGALKRAVTLAEVKADPDFADFTLVRLPRLSVMPVPAPLWKKLMALSKA